MQTLKAPARSHGGTHCLPPEGAAESQWTEPGFCMCLVYRFIGSLALSSWMVRVGAFQNVYLALTLVSRRRPNMCCLSPPSSSGPSHSSRQIQMEKASLWHHAGLHSGWTEEGCHATHVNLTDRTFQGKNVPGESGSCLESNIKTSSQCKQVWCLNLNATQQYGLSRSEKAREEDQEQSSQGGVETNASMGFGCLPWNYDGSQG